MKCLVAGGAGFIGSHLIDSLLNEGHNVVSIDNFSLGRVDNIKHLINNPFFKSYHSDLTDIDALNRIFKEHKFEHVFHLAANSDIKTSTQSPEIEYKNTFLTTYYLMECMRIYSVKKLFFSSTSAVYGEKAGESLKEDAVPLNPISYYGAAKLSSEAFIAAYSYMNDFDSLIFRFPNVIGSRLTHGVVFDFINKLRENSKKLVILGDGTQSKPYMHISDLINGIMSFTCISKPGVSMYNIGVETKTSVKIIADIICEEMGLKDVEYSYTGGKAGWKGDIPTFEYDLHKIYKTGWRAKFTSDEALRKTVKEVLGCTR